MGFFTQFQNICCSKYTLYVCKIKKVVECDSFIVLDINMNKFKQNYRGTKLIDTCLVLVFKRRLTLLS